MAVLLSEAKSYLRVVSTAEDALIEDLVAAATTAAYGYLGRDPGSLDPEPQDVKYAILLEVGNLYLNRESVSDRPYNRNPTFARLLDPYRLGMGV